MRSELLWKRLAIVAGVAVVIFLTAGIIIAGRNEIPLPPASQTMQLEQGLINNHHISTKSWSVSFDHGEIAPDGSSATLSGIHDGVFYRKGKPYLTLSAEEIMLNRATLDFTAVGKVNVKRIDQDESFDTDSILWTNSLKLLKLPHPAYLHTGGQTLKVENVTVDLSKRTIHIGKLDGEISVRRPGETVPQ
jgi:hypothetical protein